MGEPPVIACSLDAVGQQARLRDWATVLAEAAGREETAGGVRYTFAAGEGLETRLRDLAAAERACCPFLEFAVSRVGERIEMTITAPAHGQEALDFLLSARPS